MKFFLFYFVIQFALILSSASSWGDKKDNKCLQTFKSTKKDVHIKELIGLGSAPITEQKIIKRVLSGEDVRLVDLNQIRENYKDLQTVFPEFDIYLAYKAFSSTRSLGVLSEKSNPKFEIATLEEFKILTKKGILPENIIFTHPDKDALEISSTFKGGIRTFVSDSEGDLLLLAKYAPESKILIRVLPHLELESAEESAKESDKDTIENFDERFGVSFKNAKKLISKARDLNLKPVGLSFHVGSQTEDATAWRQPIAKSAQIFNEMKNIGIHLDTLDIGGGFPMRYTGDIPKLDQFGKSIKKAFSDSFNKDIYPKTIIIEPGRFVGASAAITIGRVISVKKSPWHSGESIISASTGRYSAGIVHTGYGFSFYSIEKNKRGSFCSPLKSNTGLGNIYGKACASIDKLTPFTIQTPLNLKSGDLMVISGTGAYSGEIATSNWCGKKAPTDIIFDSKTGRLVYEGMPGC